MDIKHIKPVPRAVGDIDRQEAIGGVTVHVCELQGRRNEQEDAYMVKGVTPTGSGRMRAIVKKAFEETAVEAEGHNSGTVAALAVASTDNKLTTGHLGDSEIFLFVRDGKTGKVQLHELTKPHSLKSPYERRQVRAAGGKIIRDGGRFKVEGAKGYTLGVPRAIGDQRFPGVNTTPTVNQFDLEDYAKAGDQIFIAVCCDGLHPRTVKPTEYAEIIEQACNQNREQEIPSLMTGHAYRHSSGDNLSVLFAELTPGRSQDIIMGVFDGHGGRKAADHVAQLLGDKLGNASWVAKTGGKRSGQAR